MTTSPRTPTRLREWQRRRRELKIGVYALYLAYRDPRVPWYAKAFAASVAAYAFSPIDLIPDAIPIVGYLDEIVLLPLGVNLALQMIPHVVREEYLGKAQAVIDRRRPISLVGAAVIIAIWLVLGVAAFRLVARLL